MTKRESKKTVKEAVATKELKQKVVQQLKEIPIPTYVCQKLGIPKATYYKWRKTDNAFREASDKAIISGKLTINDIAKSQLIKMINTGDFRSINLWLKHNDPDFNPKLTLEIKETKRDFDPVRLKELERAMNNAGLIGVTLAHRELEKKYRELMIEDEQRDSAREEYLEDSVIGEQGHPHKGGIRIADLEKRRRKK